jgi:hypothetical protein
MNDGILLQAQSNQRKPTIPYSLNEKSIEILDSTLMEVQIS